MSKIKILVDSASDMSTEMCEQLGIYMLPLTVSFNDKEYLDSIDITPEQFVDLLHSTKIVPKTSMVSPSRIYEALERYSNEYDEVLYITISSEISGTYNAAHLAAQEINSAKEHGNVTVYDSKTFSVGQAMMAKLANDMAHAGDCVKMILEKLAEIRARQRCLFALTDLNYVKAGGRVSAAQAFIGGILDIKPLLHITQEGCPVIISKARGLNKTISNMIDNISKEVMSRLGEVWYIHCDADGMIERLENLVTDKFEPMKTYICKARGCIGSHGGPGLFGMAYLIK